MRISEIIDKYRHDKNCQDIIKDLEMLKSRNTIEDYLASGLDYFQMDLIVSRNRQYLEKIYHIVSYLYDMNFTQQEIADVLKKDRTSVYNSLMRFNDLLKYDNKIKESYINFTNYMESIYD